MSRLGGRSPGGGASGAELVAIVDEQNRVVGSAPRAVMRAQGLYHRATFILVFNSVGELLLQKRTSTKDLYPGYWDAAAGGVVLAGETYEEGAARELAEELGIGAAPLSALFDFLHADEGNRVWGRAYVCTCDGPVTLQEEEVECVEPLAPAEVLRRAETEPFTPDTLYVLRRYLAETGPGP